MIERRQELNTIEKLLKRNPVVGIIGARQVGKTTLAQQYAAQTGKAVNYYDLENPEDEARLADPMLALKQHKGLVVIDEIQRHPDIFPILRVLSDRKRTPARFLILGSASPELMQKSSETLAGRVAYHHLNGFSLDEVKIKDGVHPLLDNEAMRVINSSPRWRPAMKNHKETAVQLEHTIVFRL